MIDEQRRAFLTYLLGGAATAPFLLAAACENSSQVAKPEETPTAPAPEEKAPPEPKAEAPKEEPAATGETVKVELEVGDGIQFNVKEIKVAAGSTVELSINHTGKLPKAAMGHNWVLLKPGTDMEAFANAATTSAETEYVPAAMKDQVIAHTKVVGGGESDSISFTAPAAGEYNFLCSFPGHYFGMNGKFIVS